MMQVKISRHGKPAIFSMLCIAIIWIAVFLVLKYSPYPELDAFKSLPCSTRIYDCSGKLLQVLPLEEGLRRERYTLDEIPAAVKAAFIEAEDKRFYVHSGIDVRALFRAFFQNVSSGRTVSGGSTITMQLARLITPRTARTFSVKITEAWNALRLEERLTKNEILEYYLNHIGFGYNTEGVASASRTFFSKDITSLTLEESCLLAVIPRSPSQYSPLEHPESCIMASLPIYTELLSQSTEKQSVRETSDSTNIDALKNAALNAHRFQYPYEFPHYIRYLTEQPEDIISPLLYTESEVHLSASLTVQKRAEDLLSRMIDTYSLNRLSNGAILAFDTQTGEIIAWVGSGSFSNNATEGQIDGVLTPNQPGSSMKPFLYALALDSGYTAATILPDIPHDFGAEELYIPQNFNNRFNGPVTLRVALASSLNVPAVWLLNRIGLSNYKNKLLSLGFDSLTTQDPGLSLALGGAEVTLFELTRAFSIFSRDGTFIPLRATPPYPESSSFSDGLQMYDRNSARLIANILSDKQARALGFGYSSVFETPFSAIFKTGTANQYQNITALASTPLYTVGVWMGNFSGETVIGKTGSSLPASIANDILCFLQQTDSPAFPEPEQYATERICSLSGMKAGEYCPNTRLEYLPSGCDTGVCTWHTEHDIVYPEEYQEWLSVKSRQGTISYNGNPLTIETPRNGSIFFYDASALGRNQVISVSVTGGADDVLSVLLTDELSGKSMLETEVIRPFNFTLPLSKGIWKLSVKNGNESYSISYTVK